MKKILFSIIIGFLGIVSNAQEPATLSTVYLHDGSQIKGWLTGQQSAEYIGFRLNGGAEIQIPRKSVKAIAEQVKDLRFFKNGKFIKTKGLYKMLSTGIAPAWDDDREYIQWGGHVLHGVVGYQFNQYLSAGFGIGLDVYSNTFFPFYADFRGYILEKKISPYYAVQVGYSLSNDLFNNFLENVHFKGGPMLHPTLGLRFASFRQTKFIAEGGYKFQWDTRTYEWNENVDKILFKRLTFKIGWLF